MITMLLGLGALLSIALSAFFSGTETGIYCLDPVKLRVRSDHNRPAARRLARLMRRPDELVIAALVGTNLSDYLATVCVAALLLRASVATGLAEVYTTAILTPIILVFGGVMPKDWFQRESDRLMYALATPLLWWKRVVQATGLMWVLRALTRTLMRWIDPRLAGREEQLLPRARMRRLLHEGAARGGLTTFQRDIIERVLNVSHVRVADVMIPRQRIASVPADIPRADFLRLARMAHFSRLPVYRTQPHNVIGVVNVYDVLTDGAAQPIERHVRDAVALDAEQRVPAALTKLQEKRQAMAIIRDRAGRCIGILTIKDLVEEIVGELDVW
jgi:CBS domain containing-hemolysin-like protein